MPKYDRLAAHLATLDRAESHNFSFDRIEALLGFALPKSARAYQAWWANQRTGGHVQANAWLDEGWHTEQLSLTDRRVTFKPVATPRAPRIAQGLGMKGLSIDQARQQVAVRYGVKRDQIEIVIRA